MDLTDRRRKTLHYRHAMLLPVPATMASSGNSFQDRVERSLKSLGKVSERCFFPDYPKQDGSVNVEKHSHLFVSRFEDVNGMLCAELVYIEPGTSVAVVSRSQYDEGMLEYEALAPINDGANQREYLDSIAYVGIISNHIILMQSKAILIKDIEDYFNFILEKSTQISDKELIIFQANNVGFNKGSLRDKAIKNVKLSLPLTAGNEVYDSDTSYQILNALIGETRVNDIRKHSTKDSSDLLINVSIGYKYNTSSQNEMILGKIAQDLVDNRDEELTVELKGSGRLVGDELKLKTDEMIPFNNSLPMRDYVYDKMVAWLIDLLEKGIINP